MKTVLTLAVFAALTAVSSAQLVTNGGFETGDFTGWTTTNTSLLAVRTSNTTFPAYEGLSDATFGTTSTTAQNTISQSIATTVGQSYTLSFYLREAATSTSTARSFTATFGSGSLTFGALTTTYARETVTMTATSASTALTFMAYNSPTYYMLDGITVTPQAVPEPSTVAALGIGAVALLRRRKRA